MLVVKLHDSMIIQSHIVVTQNGQAQNFHSQLMPHDWNSKYINTWHTHKKYMQRSKPSQVYCVWYYCKLVGRAAYFTMYEARD